MSFCEKTPEPGNRFRLRLRCVRACVRACEAARAGCFRGGYGRADELVGIVRPRGLVVNCENTKSSFRVANRFVMLQIKGESGF